MKVDQGKVYATGWEDQHNTNLNLKREFDTNSELGDTKCFTFVKRI